MDRESKVFPRLTSLRDIMYLLYADESGSTYDAGQRYFVLAGFCVFERQCFWLDEELEKIAARFDPADTASVELHGSPMLSGKKQWRQYPKEERERAILDALHLVKSHPSNRVFASVIKKTSVSPLDPVNVAFEQMASRFDYYLRRLHKGDNPQRGLVFSINLLTKRRFKLLRRIFGLKGIPGIRLEISRKRLCSLTPKLLA